MADTAERIDVIENESLNNQTGSNNESERTQVNNLIVVNKARPEILVEKSRVNRLRTPLKSISAIIKEKIEGEQVPDTFMFNTQDLIWGIVRELDGSTRFSKHTTSFPASSWSVLPTLRSDMLLSNIVDFWQNLLALSSDRFREAYGHSMDGIEIDIVQIYVPAGIEFINPYGRDNTGKVYDTDYVFTFIVGFHYNINDFNQLTFIRDIYNGSPKEIVDDNGVITIICQTNNLKKRLPPRIFAKSLVNNGYFGDVSKEQFDDLVEVLSY